MKLFVLGNGFDISHKIESSFKNFYTYLHENKPDILEVMGKFYWVEEDSKLWSDFEISLDTDIDFESLVDIIGENSPHFLSANFKCGDWHDAEIYVEHEGEELLRNIRIGFEAWINSLDVNNVKKVYSLDVNDFYITFNYTETLERGYRIPSNNILHIHNKVGEKLIFGHGCNLDNFDVKLRLYGDKNAFTIIDEHGNVESTAIGHERFAENAICSFFEMMRKPTETIIKDNLNNWLSKLDEINEIIILGHSYNEIDFPYFKKISDTLKDKIEWTLYYFSDDDIQSAIKLMRELNIDESLVTYKHCDELKSS